MRYEIHRVSTFVFEVRNIATGAIEYRGDMATARKVWSDLSVAATPVVTSVRKARRVAGLDERKAAGH